MKFNRVSPLLLTFGLHPLHKIPQFRLTLGQPVESPHALAYRPIVTTGHLADPLHPSSTQVPRRHSHHPVPPPSPHVFCTSHPSFSPSMHLGSEPLRQFRYQSQQPPSVLISPDHYFDAGRPAPDMIPTVRDMDAERSRPASRTCHNAQLSIVGDTPQFLAYTQFS